MASTIQVRVDDDLKTKSDALFKELGTDTTSAIRMFLTQAVANNGFPFEIKRTVAEYNPYAPLTEEELFAKLEVSRQHASQGKYRGADEVASDMRAKYGL
ncbi:type II toxin-antitoxin system RelB/DinJ family antitoxin [Anaerosacchariphilus polymeriproducens]|uniref:Type II toxin-antitoxin system RelB/DinJ family antitoxin n=1 Tax=Anaerosacchariphilus polymeriproducens TaxID=1812858 RepID=A0A371AYH6_9FIRM|nr:type II toxin-antitoxin system RelB/DinJ family antitoxin [Anaerosacchariphilus polymeriproducens]RDU24589.1 type II toxin-antitoxin system RelB/DinJ family antitoxin [Anaerosacchariphilus polymeriproducens]